MPAARQGSRPGDGLGPAWPELEDSQPQMLYGVFGEEDFLVAQQVARFLAAPAFQDNPSLNIERFYAGDTPPVRVLESAVTLPFLGNCRLVMLHECHLYKAEQQNQFLDYLAQPCPSTCLVFSGAKLDSRTKFAKALSRAGQVHIFKRLYPRQLIPWLQERAAARDKRLSPEAAQALAEMAGLGLSALDSEVEKLALFVGRGGQIGLSEVEAVTASGRLYSIFDFTDALTARSLARALTSLDQLVALGEPPVRILAMVVRLHRQLLEVRGLLDAGRGESQVQKALRTPPAATRSLLARASRETGQALLKRLGRILKADMALKSSPGSERVIMERLVMDLCA